MEVKHGTHITLSDFFLIVCCAQECQGNTVSTQGRLDNIRNVFFFLLIIKIAHILAGYILMLC